MDLVVGASESTVKSLLGKLGGLLAQEYTLIRGVGGDLQYITDELRTMQSFLRDLRDAEQDHRMKDWMKQIRDMTYDLEDCVDDSGHRIHNPRWLRRDMCCYFLVNSIYEVLTWWPRRDISSKISDLKMRAQQIGERRHRYGVDNPKSIPGGAEGGPGPSTGFNAAENQDPCLQLVTTADPVGVDSDMNKLERWMQDKANKNGVLAIVGFGGVGKTIIATDLYRKFGDHFDCRAMVTVSQGSDLVAILTSIKNQVMQQSDDQKQQGSDVEKKRLAAVLQSIRATSRVMAKSCCNIGSIPGDSAEPEVTLPSDSDHLSDSYDEEQQADSDHQAQQGRLPDIYQSFSDDDLQGNFPEKKSLTAAVKDLLGQVNRRTSAIMAKCIVVGTSQETQDNAKLSQLKDDLKNLLTQNSYLLLIDDVWSTSTWEQIRRSLPPSNNDSRIIVTTRFQAVATTCTRDKEESVLNVKALGRYESEKLFKQAVSESKGKRYVKVPEEVWQLCGGLPLAIVSMAGHVGCNPGKSHKEWLNLCRSLFPESVKNRRTDLTQEEVGRIVSHCYNDMPAEIKTCSMYLSIFPKGNRISRKRLTRRWIAEGFVSEKQGMSMEDVAETYFTHLIRRKIIRPVEHNSIGKVKNCVVHDMILEHIVAQASEENFIAVVGGHWLMQTPSSKVRRLSLQGGDSKRAKDTENMNLSHVRSLTMFGSLNQLPLHCFKFRIVQVLDLEGCTDFRQHHANEICEMLFLKYLGLRRTDIKELPKAIKKLEKLETLDIRETKVLELPNTVCNLGRLVNILGGNKRTIQALRLPEELVKKKKMAGLRILSGIEISGESADLHHLTELRKLVIYSLRIKKGSKASKDLGSSIEYLGGFSLHSLVIYDESSWFLQSLGVLASPPKFFIALELCGQMVTLPSWITGLDVLNKLTLSVTLLQECNLKHLSTLKALFSLTFTSSGTKQDQKTMVIIEKNRSGPSGEIILPPGGFLKLKLLRFSSPHLPLLRFSKNTMPSLERLELRFSVLEGLLGTENLRSLKEVHLSLRLKKKGVSAKKNDITMEQIKKWIENDIPGFTSKHDDVSGAPSSTAKKPKIIFTQYYD